MIKTRFGWFALLLVSLALILLYAATAKSDDANSYGVAKFYEPIYFPRDGMVERWVLDPGLSGDMTGGTSNMESWQGTAVGGCTDCPTSWGCNCTTGGDVNPNTTYVYNLNTSAALSATGAFHSILYYPFDFEANTAYQISFKYKGHDGTEDAIFSGSNMTLTETYNFATNTWTVPISGIQITNASTSWTKVSVYLTTGAVAKTSYLFGAIIVSSDGTALYVDDFTIRELDQTGVVGEHGNVLSVPVTADPVFGESPELMHKPGSGLATSRGMWLDGTNDYLSRADDDTFDPSIQCVGSGSNFSVWCRGVVTDSIAAVEYPIFGKDTTGSGQSGWLVTRYRDDLYFYQSNDGVFGSNTGPTGQGFVVNGVTNFVATYKYVGAANSEANMYINNEAVTFSNTLEGPIFNSTAALTVGHTLGSFFPGYWATDIEQCAFHCGELTAIQANKIINPYFPGTRHGDGFYVDTCSQAASHATCTLERCRDGTPNACQAEGTGVMALFGSKVDLLDNNDFSEFTGDDSSPDWDTWDETVQPDGDTATLTAYRADSRHGSVSMRFRTERDTGWPTITVYSKCLTTGVGDDIHLYLYAKKLSGTANFRMAIARYTDGACSVGAGGVFTIRSYSDIEAGQWNLLEGTMEAADWSGTENSYKVQLVSSQSSPNPPTADFLIDTISLKEGTYYTPWSHCADGAAPCTYNARDYRLHNPLSDRSDILREDMYESGFCYSAWLYSDWSADGGFHVFYTIPTTGGSDNVSYFYKWTNNVLYFEVYDGAGASRYYAYGPVTNTTWTAGDWKFVEACSNNTGTLKAHYYNLDNKTWYNLAGPSGAGTGVQDDQSDEFHVGHQAAGNFCDCYQPEVHIVPYSAVYPNAGFNSGKAPVNGRPF